MGAGLESKAVLGGTEEVVQASPVGVKQEVLCEAVAQTRGEETGLGSHREKGPAVLAARGGSGCVGHKAGWAGDGVGVIGDSSFSP